MRIEGWMAAGLIAAALAAVAPAAPQALAQQPGTQQPGAQQPGAQQPGTPARPQQGQGGQRGGPRSPSLWGFYAAAQAAERGNDFDAAHEQIEQALRRDPADPELVANAFRLRVLVGKLPAAAELAPRILALRPNDGLASMALAVAAVRKGEFRAAETNLARLGQDGEAGILVPYSLAWLRAGQRDFAGARAQLERIRPPDGDPALAPHTAVSGLVEELAGERAEAERRLRRALELDPDGLRTTLAVAGFLRRAGKALEARDILRQYQVRNADAVLMDALIAADAAPRAPNPADGIADVLFDIGGAFAAQRRERNDDFALAMARMALELRPDFDLARFLAAEVFEQQRQPRKALEMYEGVDRLSPLNWRARLRAAAVLADLDRADAAAAALRSMVAERPERIDAAAALGDFFRTKEKFAEAIAPYDTAIQRVAKPEERHWPLFYARGIALERAKQWPRAEADFRKALELSPDQAYVLNYLGYSWIDQGINLDEGMRMLKRANQLRPDDGAITDSVGWAYYRLGDYPRAVEWLEKAIELKADDATIVEHLGDAYWQVGRRREARFQWERALRQNPEADRIGPIKDKLEGRAEPEAARAAPAPDRK